MNIRYDEHLQFNLPDSYYVEKSVNDNGDSVFTLNTGKKTDKDGSVKYDHTVKVDCNEGEIKDNPDLHPLKLNGNYNNVLSGRLEEVSVMMITVKLIVALFAVQVDANIYYLQFRRVIKNTDDENFSSLLKFMNDIIQSIVIDGKSASFSPVSNEEFLSSLTTSEERAELEAPFPYAKPGDGQHSHLDFQNRSKNALSFFGGATVNANGTEYSFQKISEYDDYGDNSTLRSLYRQIVNADQGGFGLADKAVKMAELFRVDPECFDSGHDREQEILNGMIQRTLTYDSFRSFVWTLCAYCDQKGIKPGDADYDTLQSILDYIVSRDGLNFKADSYSPALCSGDDIHVYYIPDSVRESLGNKLLQIVNEGAENALSKSGVASLDQLRKELEYVYPAMKTIHDVIKAEREDREPLLSGCADMLYAWCSITYAAREPVFTEDGPMNCMWMHPEEENPWGKTKGTTVKEAKRSSEKNTDKRLSAVELEKIGITYHDHLSVSGSGYHIDIPDGFRIRKNVEGRDFIAYIPKEENPDDYDLSSFTIFSVNKIENDLFKDFRLPCEWSACGKGIERSFAGSSEDTKSEDYNREDLPGTIIYSYEPGCLHVLGAFGIEDHIQLFRLLIADIKREDKAVYQKVAKELFNHIYPDKFVNCLTPLNDSSYIRLKPTAKSAEEWEAEITNHLNHINASRLLAQNAIVNGFKENQKQGNGNVSLLKYDLKKLLYKITDYKDQVMRNAFSIYALKKSEYPDNKNLAAMMKTVSSLTELPAETISLSGQEITVSSEYADIVKKGLSKNSLEIADYALKNCVDGDATELKEALINAGRNAKQVAEEAERRKRQEEQKKRQLEEENRKKAQYSTALEYASSDKMSVLKVAIEEFEKLGDYSDAIGQAESARKKLAELEEKDRIEKENAFKEAQEIIHDQSASIENLEHAAKLLESVAGFEGIELLQNECKVRVLKERKYEEAVKLAFVDTIESLHKASGNLNEIVDYKDSKELLEKYNKRIADLEEKARLEKLEQERLKAERIAEEQKKKKKARIRNTIVAIIAALLIGAGIYYVMVIQPQQKYAQAVELMEEEHYEEAKAIFIELGNYENSVDLAEECDSEMIYRQAAELMNDRSYEEAKELLETISEYKDSAGLIDQCNNSLKFIEVDTLIKDKKYGEAIENLLKMREEGLPGIDQRLSSIALTYYRDDNYERGDQIIEMIEDKSIVDQQEIDSIIKQHLQTMILNHNAKLKQIANYGKYVEKFFEQVSGDDLYNVLEGNWTGTNFSNIYDNFYFDSDGSCFAPGKTGHTQNWSVSGDLLILSYNRPDGTYVRKISDDCYALCSTVNNDIWIILYK